MCVHLRVCVCECVCVCVCICASVLSFLLYPISSISNPSYLISFIPSFHPSFILSFHPAFCPLILHPPLILPSSPSQVFNPPPDIPDTARRVIILEEDLQIAPDFFEYFAALVEMIDTDDQLLGGRGHTDTSLILVARLLPHTYYYSLTPILPPPIDPSPHSAFLPIPIDSLLTPVALPCTSLSAVSAWNDNGQKNIVRDPTALYRSDFFPGLGWMMSRRVWEVRDVCAFTLLWNV